MANTEKKTFPRRDFLRGAAGLVGASVVGIGASPAFAQGKGNGGVPGLSLLNVAYWDGVALTSADKLSMGDNTLTQVTVTLRGYGIGTSIGSITAYPQGAGGAPFYAWTAPPSGCTQTSFLMPVNPVMGMLVSSQVVVGKSAQAVPTQFFTGTGSGLKLREGVYILTAAPIDWTTYMVVPGQPDAPLVSRSGIQAPFQYVVMTVERA